jgi:CTP synthase (UTP-ammonia lyase)
MTDAPVAPARLALVGNRSSRVRAHERIPVLLGALRRRHGLTAEAYWIPSEQAEDPRAVAGFDGVWLLPGSPYRSEAGALTAVRDARERSIPFLGTCGGFQHAVLEYAPAVCGLTSAAHGENEPNADDLVIVPLACSLVGHEGLVRLRPGSRAEEILGAESCIERYHCTYGLNPAYHDRITGAGLRFTGFDENEEPRLAELSGHPFFVATLFQPELAGDGGEAHPLIRAFVAAAAAHASPTPV